MRLAWCHAGFGLVVVVWCSAAAANGQGMPRPPEGGLYAPIPPGAEMRVLVVPSNVRRLPPEVSRLFEQAVAGAGDGVVVVDNLNLATDVVQLTYYELQLDEQRVQQTWQITYRPLQETDERAARLLPFAFLVSVEGKTLSDCARSSTDALRDQLRRVLARFHFRPYVPR